LRTAYPVGANWPFSASGEITPWLMKSKGRSFVIGADRRLGVRASDWRRNYYLIKSLRRNFKIFVAISYAQSVTSLELTNVDVG
jgi:hypothetical protein